MAFWPHFNLHASTKGQTQDTVTQKTHTHTLSHRHTHPPTLNCCWAGEGQTAVGSILHVASDRCDRVALKLGARTHLLLLPLFFSSFAAAPSSSGAASAKCALGTFLEYSFSLFVYVFLTCTKHLPSIFADTFYTQSTFSLRPPPLSLFCQFVQLLVVVSFALDVYLNVYVALLFPLLKHF